MFQDNKKKSSSQEPQIIDEFFNSLKRYDKIKNFLEKPLTKRTFFILILIIIVVMWILSVVFKSM